MVDFRYVGFVVPAVGLTSVRNLKKITQKMKIS